MRTLLALTLVLAAAWPAAALEVGDPAPDFPGEGKWLNGPAAGANLAEMRGRVVLLELFRTW